MRVVSIHQPAYLPWLGYFHKIILSDVFVYLDTVQFEKNSYTNRNIILTDRGPIWLTVPVIHKGHTTSLISRMEIAPDNKWKKKHIQSIKFNYCKTPYFNEYFPELERMILGAGNLFSDFVYDMTMYFLVLLGIETAVVRSSSLLVQGEKSKLVENICSYLAADLYVSGVYGRDYLDRGNFSRAGIGIYFQEYCHPVYRQFYPGFSPGMSIIDTIMNAGARQTLALITSGNITRKELEEIYV